MPSRLNNHDPVKHGRIILEDLESVADLASTAAMPYPQGNSYASVIGQIVGAPQTDLELNPPSDSIYAVNDLSYTGEVFAQPIPQLGPIAIDNLTVDGYFGLQLLPGGLLNPSFPGAIPLEGGSLTYGTTYYWVITLLTPAGESTPLFVPDGDSPAIIAEASYTPYAPFNAALLQWKHVPGEIGYNIYRTTTQGVYSEISLVATLMLTFATYGLDLLDYTDLGNPTAAGAPPTTNAASSGPIIFCNEADFSQSGCISASNQYLGAGIKIVETLGIAGQAGGGVYLLGGGQLDAPELYVYSFSALELVSIGAEVNGIIHVVQLYCGSCYLQGDFSGNLNINCTTLSINEQTGANGSFTSADGKTVTVVNGIITGIS